MAEDNSQRQNKASLTGSMSLLRELQHDLYEISLQAEIGRADSLHQVRIRAEQALKLIDSCIATTQVELGQTQLNLVPYGMGSIMHEAAHELRLVTGQPVAVKAGVNQPVMTNSDLLNSLLRSAGQFIFESAKKPLFIRSFSTPSGELGIGVFSKDFNVTPKDLRQALDSSSHSQMPMSQHTQKSGVLILLADAIAGALGGELSVKRLGSYRGFATILPKSQQLSLIGD